MLFELEFQPGDPLSQTKLADRIGCSTVPVVEAMRRLESDGLLVKEGPAWPAFGGSLRTNWKNST